MKALTTLTEEQLSTLIQSIFKVDPTPHRTGKLFFLDDKSFRSERIAGQCIDTLWGDIFTIIIDGETLMRYKRTNAEVLNTLSYGDFLGYTFSPKSTKLKMVHYNDGEETPITFDYNEPDEFAISTMMPVPCDFEKHINMCKTYGTGTVFFYNMNVIENFYIDILILLEHIYNEQIAYNNKSD